MQYQKALLVAQQNSSLIEKIYMSLKKQSIFQVLNKYIDVVNNSIVQDLVPVLIRHPH